MKPIVKWVGGKRSILPILLEKLPKEYDKYYEPFVGGGALFLAVSPKRALISDVNPYLMSCYRAAKNDLPVLIALLDDHISKHSKEHFLECRKFLTEQTDDYVKTAACFMYLNRTCFNGLYRVNKSGGFNVPMGSYKTGPKFDVENLKEVSIALQNVEIWNYGFKEIPKDSNGFYYMDPPYHNTFNSYDKTGFGDQGQVDLFEYCRGVHEIGGKFAVSNSNTDFIQNLYSGFKIEKILAKRSISCKGNQRGQEEEVLITNY